MAYEKKKNRHLTHETNEEPSKDLFTSNLQAKNKKKKSKACIINL